MVLAPLAFALMLGAAASVDQASLVQRSQASLSHRPASPTEAQNLGRIMHDVRWSLRGQGWRSAAGGLVELGGQSRRLSSLQGVPEAQLREAWWMRTWTHGRLRIGRDVLNEGFFDTGSGLDQLGPMDFGRMPEDFMSEPEWRRAPTWFMRLEWFGERLTSQLTYLPVFQPHRIRLFSGETDLSEMNLGTPIPAPLVGASYRSIRAAESALLEQGTPASDPTSGTADLRVGSSSGRIGWTAVVAWLWDRVPRISAPSGLGLSDAFGFADEVLYRRHLRVGGEAEVALGSFLMRVLAVHSPSRTALSPTPAGGFEWAATPWSQGGAGLEFQGGTDLRIGCDALVDVAHTAAQDGRRFTDEAYWPANRSAALRLAPTASMRPFTDAAWRLEFGGLLQPTSRDGLVLGEVVVDSGDDSELRVGGNVFYGPAEAPLGGFNNRDGLWIRYRRSW